MGNEIRYVLWSQEYQSWYADPGRGLTLYIDEVHYYTKEEALKHLREIRVERDNEQITALPEILLRVEERS